MLLDALLPNRAWWSRFRALPDRPTRAAYVWLRLGFVFLAIGASAILAFK